jgi:hypothetical protein
MDKVSIERAYRIVKALDDFAKDIKEKQLPLLKNELESWRGKIVIADLVIITLLVALGVAAHLQYGIWSDINVVIGGGVGAFAVWLLSHIKNSSFLAKRAAKKYEKENDNAMAMAILKNTTFMRSLFGIGKRWYINTINNIDNLIGKSKETIQKLNDQFVSPSGAIKQESNQGN